MEEIPDTLKAHQSEVDQSEPSDTHGRMIPLSQIIAGYAENNASGSSIMRQPSKKSKNLRAMKYGVLVGIIISSLSLIIFLAISG